MLKVLAVARTVFLIFIVGFTIRAMPLFLSNVSKTFDEQYARCADGLGLVSRAAWLAIAWIGLETLLGWYLATRKPRPAKEAASSRIPPGEPPFAPPPRR
jgi:hypothetical protein